MEENLKEEIEFWQILIEEAENSGDADSIPRMTDALRLAEYKLDKRRLRLESSHRSTDNSIGCLCDHRYTRTFLIPEGDFRRWSEYDLERWDARIQRFYETRSNFRDQK